jgi:hypothetical protein
MRHNQHPVVTEPDMGGLHNHRQTIQQDDPVAPVKLIGFSNAKLGVPPTSTSSTRVHLRRLLYHRRARALDNISPLFIFMLHEPSEIRTEHCTYFRARHFEALSNARARHDPLNVSSHFG